jgi:uncharacterized damage-inducible protein DinB
MSDEMVQRFRRWFEYEKDAHAKVVRSLESVPHDRRDAPEYQKATSILAHLAMARRIWLGRLGVIPLAPGSLFPEGMELAEVIEELRVIQAQWSSYLGRLRDQDLSRTMEYQSLDAGRCRNSLEDILTQLFGHSSYHRGQIASLVRLAGGEPAATDYIYWCREPVAPAARD